MKYLPYSRKRNQLKRLARQLASLMKLESHQRDYKRINRLISKVRHLVEQLRHLISPLELRRVLGSTALIIGFAFTNPISAQEFAVREENPFGLISRVNPTFPDMADLDGDGDMDILAGTSGRGVVFYENISSEDSTRFAIPSKNPFGLEVLSYRPVRPNLADFDGDGDIDMLILTQIDDNIFQYFENIGTPTSPQFAAPQDNPFGLAASSDIRDMDLVDIDDDGDLDLLVAESYYPAYSIFHIENIGSPTEPQFTTPVENPFGFDGTYKVRTMTFADMDADGDEDLISTACCGGVNNLYFENTGSSENPQFTTPLANPFGLENGLGSPVVVDMDMDGDIDLLGGLGYSDLIYYENVGTPTEPYFGERQRHPFELVTMGKILDITSADFDGDGDIDLLGIDTGLSDKTRYFENTGSIEDPDFAKILGNPFGIDPGRYVLFVASADLDADGDVDLLFGQPSGGRFVYLENTGSEEEPAFASPEINPFGLGNYNSYFVIPAFADLDGDGDMDLLTGEMYGEGLMYFENIGSATEPEFTTSQLNPFGLGETYTYFATPAFADLDSDGDMDLLCGNGEDFGDLWYLENIGSPSEPQFAAGQKNPFGLTSASSLAFPVFADMESDGDQDLLLATQNGWEYFENVSPTNISLAFSSNKLKVYPNPSKGVLQIESNVPIKKVEVLNMLGQRVKTFQGNKKTLSIKEFQSGVYYIRALDHQGHYWTAKILKE